MNTITNNELVTAQNQLYRNLIALNQSVKGKLPIISTKHMDDINGLPLSNTALAWNWSKSFNY